MYYASMYVCMYVLCMYVGMCVCMYVRTNGFLVESKHSIVQDTLQTDSARASRAWEVQLQLDRLRGYAGAIGLHGAGLGVFAAASFDQHGLLGLKGPFTDPYLGPNRGQSQSSF